MSTFAYDHVGLSVADLDAQSRFYTTALGLSEQVRTEIPHYRIRTAVLSSPGGPAIELIERRGSRPHSFADAYEGSGTQGFFHWALRVHDLDATFASILDAGATAVSAPAAAARPGYRFAYVKDPEGNLIELLQPTG